VFRYGLTTNPLFILSLSQHFYNAGFLAPVGKTYVDLDLDSLGLPTAIEWAASKRLYWSNMSRERLE
jgi:hypothetical protein